MVELKTLLKRLERKPDLKEHIRQMLIFRIKKGIGLIKLNLAKKTYWCPYDCGKKVAWEKNSHVFVCESCGKMFNSIQQLKKK